MTSSKFFHQQLGEDFSPDQHATRANTIDNWGLKPFSAALQAHHRGLRRYEDVMPKIAGKIARRSFLIGTALAPFAPSLANAQAPNIPAWPARPVTLIIPFPAGGAMDLLGRGVAQDLTDKLGQPLTTSPGPHVQAGRLRALAVTSATRTQQLPEVPTVEQAGFPGFEPTAWFALAAPTGTPAGIIAKIN